MSDYDVIVLGGGAPGEHCAGALAGRGMHVALVERELVGGECSYWACIPSKSLLRPGEAVHGALEAGAKAEVDVQAALAWRDFMVSDWSDSGQVRWLASRGIDLLRGRGRLAGTGVVEVEGAPHTAQHVVVATGAEPVVPPITGLPELEGVWGTREATSMKVVPRRLLVLGGGPAGVEIAQIVRRFGGEAVIIEGAGRLLPREAAPLGDGLGDALRADGIEVLLGTHATAARLEGDEYVLQVDGGGEVRGDRLLVATGRRPRVEGIGLETVGVQAGPHGIPVDDHLRAGERLWAIGDVTGIWPLTHVGEYQGDVVAANIAGEARPANYEAVPRVTYTDPQAAAVGALEAKYSGTAPMSDVSKTATYTHDYAQSNGFLTLLSDGERLTGAYALGPEAGEWMQQATLAIRAHVPLEVLSDTIQPSWHSAWRSQTCRGRCGLWTRRWRACRGEEEAVRTAPELAGQTVVVIGGSAGIGLETGRLARAEGADVVLAARDPDKLAEAAKEVGAGQTAVLDATDFDQLARFFDERPGPIDHVLVTGPGPYYAPLAELDLERARRDLEAHLFLPIQVARSAVGTVRPGGTLLFMGGTGGRVPSAGALITAMTAALPALTKALALEIAPVRVNLIAAGFVDTPLSASILGDQLDARREQLRSKLPIRRVVGPADIAALAVHLMANTAVTGATFDIDGGQQLVAD